MGNEFQTLGAEDRKARDANFRLWRGTER